MKEIINLEQWGFNGPEQDREEGFLVARVVAEHRELFDVVCAQGFLQARVKQGAYRDADALYPAVGDFVRLQFNEGGESLIAGTYPRKTSFSRGEPMGRKAGQGRTSAEQVVAANFDYVCIVMSLNENYNRRRLERYAALAWASGAQPVVLLTKADLAENKQALYGEAQRCAPGAEVFMLSALTGEGIETFQGFLKPGKTLVFLGSSGVGKSSLVNALMGEELMRVQEISELGARGKHTTTHRALLMLPSGVMVIDTPGMRSLGVLGADEGLKSAFVEIEELVNTCKYGDCTHKNEPGCAVRAALLNGTLDRARYESYLSLLRENHHANKRARLMKLRAEKPVREKDAPRDKAYKRSHGE